jgi:transposase
METITIPKAEYEAMKQRIIDLEQMVLSLSDQLKLLKNGRKSNTSSTPPSQDLQRSNSKSLREKTGRSPGAQPGHQGSTLKMSASPDETIEYRPHFCNGCGADLWEGDYSLTDRKQEIVLPPIIPQYVEHRSYKCTCKQCGTTTQGTLPAHLKANIQYGPDIAALTGYLSVRQYLSYNRTSEIMKDVFHIPLCQGTIDNMLKSLALNALPAYEEIQSRLEGSQVVGGDETGLKAEGKKAWLFTFQNKVLTFLAVSLSRGFESISHLFKDGFPMAVYITDCLAAQLKTRAMAHQLCTAHLLRELNNFIDAFDCQWSAEMKALLKQAIALKKDFGPADYEKENEKVKQIETQLDLLLQTCLDDKHKKIQAFGKRLNKNRDAILVFLHHSQVPPDNNASERAIRTAKVKMKVSGQFRRLAGANRFAVLRSIIDTAIKNNLNPLKALITTAKYAAE